jgi:hypothetical protein
VCSKYGLVKKPFARNQLLYDEHFTVTVISEVSEKNEYH